MERQLLVAKRTRPTVAAVTVSGGHLVLVICARGEPLDLEQVQAERLDLGQYAIQCRPVQQAGEHGVRAVMPCTPRAIGKAATRRKLTAY